MISMKMKYEEVYFSEYFIFKRKVFFLYLGRQIKLTNLFYKEEIISSLRTKNTLLKKIHPVWKKKKKNRNNIKLPKNFF